MRFLPLAAALLTAACGATMPRMALRAEPAQYTPSMSSTPGISLKPVFSPRAGGTIDYRWTASFGHFLSWDPGTGKIVDRGDDVVLTAGTVYWTYDPKYAIVMKPSATITVDAIDRDTGETRAHGEVVLDFDRDVARVRE